jgi:deoxyadenosine/deoxycytidine kinase
MRHEKPGFVVVEGPIGVGKTSLAERLAARFGSELLLEGPEENPFLERFYQDRKTGALPTQLFFLFQRAQQIQALRQADIFQPVRVADFLLEKDRLFAQLTLDAEELKLYEMVYDKLALDAPEPDLVVYLQAPVDTLMGRIARRGIHYEQAIDKAYIEKLSDAYMRFFYDWTRSPLLIVNTADINPIDDDRDFEVLFQEICRVKSGRHFFNPGRLAG